MAELSNSYIPFGAQYYRVPTPPPGEWELDLAAMARHGFTLVRFWVMWRWQEPERGRFYWDDIDRLMDLAQKNGLGVVLNTIAHCAPAWYYAEHPDGAPVTQGGEKLERIALAWRQIGGMPGPCFNYAPGVELQMDFIRACAERYASHPALLAWDVWNEPTAGHSIYMDIGWQTGYTHPNLLCYCEHCREKFALWLDRRYGGLEGLNRAWYRNYRSWAELELPRRCNTQFDFMDFRRFTTDYMIEHCRKRVAAVREHDHTHPTMYHCLCDSIWDHTTCAVDDWRMQAEVDILGNTSTDADREYTADILRSSAKGKDVWACEVHCRFGRTHMPPPDITADDMRRYIFIPLMRGVRGFIYWQYRPELLSWEAPAWGLAALSGGEAPALAHARDACRVLQENAEDVHAMRRPAARVAQIHSMEQKTFDFCGGYTEKLHARAASGLYYCFHDHGYSVDFVSPGEVEAGLLADYDVLVAPDPYWLPPGVAARIKDWVRNGGVLIAEPYFCGWDTESFLHQTTLPGYGFDEVFGCRQGSARAIRQDLDEHTELTVTSDLPRMKAGDAFTGTVVEEGYEVLSDDVTVLAENARGEAAVVAHRYGEGHAIAIGTYVGVEYATTKNRDTARFVVSCIERCYEHPPRPHVKEDVCVRVDWIRCEARTWVTVANNTGARASATVWLPDAALSKLVDLYTGEELELTAAEDGVCAKVKLPPDGFRVYDAT